MTGIFSYKRWVTGLVLVLLAASISGIGSTREAQAQFGGTPPPAGTECKLNVECKAGPYLVQITLDQATLNTTDEFLITVKRLDNPVNNDWSLGAEVVPSGRTSAVLVKYDADRFLPSSDPTQRQIKGYYPISGTWWLHLSINGTAGLGQLRIATNVEAPPKMPEWLAWAIGLAPILGLVGFGLGQWRLVMQRKNEERLAEALAQAKPQPVEPPHSMAN